MISVTTQFRLTPTRGLFRRQNAPADSSTSLRLLKRSGAERQKPYPPHKTIVTFTDQYVAVIVDGDTAALADARPQGVKEPTVTRMGAPPCAVQQYMNNARAVHIPKLATVVSQQEVTACRHRPHAANTVESGLQGGKPIATAGRLAVTCDHRARTQWGDTVNEVGASITNDHIAVRF